MEIEIGELVVDNEIKINDIELDIIKQFPALEDLEVTPTSIEQTFTHPNSYGYDEVKVKAVEADTLNISPTTQSQQHIGLYGTVNVDAVTSSIDSNIQSDNIKSGVDILGVTGTLTGLKEVDEGVNFFDYDGELLKTATKQEVANWTEMPSLPNEKDGLVAQEWNWTLSELKDHLANYGDRADVGCTRITSDGKSRFYITIGKNTNTVYFSITQTKANDVIVDWGDGSPTETFASLNTEVTHTYNFNEYTKDYIITVEPQTGEFKIQRQGSYFIYTKRGSNQDDNKINILTKIKLGRNVTNINTYAFLGSNNFEYINLPNGLISINNYAFSNAIRLKAVIFPKSMTTYGSSCFQNTYALQRIILPYGVTSLRDNLCNSDFALHTISIPSSVNTIQGQFFYNCNSLTNVFLPRSLTTLNSSIFANTNITKLELPNSLTTFSDQVFTAMTNLESIEIPSGVTTIPTRLFNSCYSLNGVKFLGDITSVANYVFYENRSIAVIDFTKCTTVPSLAGSSLISGNPSGLQILVPNSLKEEWKNSTNWSAYADYIIGV